MKQNWLLFLTIFLIGFIFGNFTKGDVNVKVNTPTSLKDVKENYYRNGFSKFLMKRYKDYSNCYKEFTNYYKTLSEEEQNKLSHEGNITYIFHLADDGAMLSYKLLSNEIDSSDITSCIEDYFDGIHFSPPPLGVSRYLPFDFVFKTEETYKKDIKERKEKSAPQVIPVNPANE